MRRGRRRGGVAFAIAAGLGVAWAVGQLARDRTLPTALLFYLPSLAVAGLVALGALIAAARGARWRALVCLLAALPPALVGLLVENRWGAGPVEQPREQRARVVGWNVAGFRFGAERIATTLREADADLVLLSEAAGRGPRDLEARFAATHRRQSIGSLTLLARGDLAPAEALVADRELQIVRVEWRFRGERLLVLGANLISSPLVPRDPLLRRLTETLARERPDLLLGDLNAPRRSRALARLPAGYRHAYDLVGHGWSATWPAPLPLLAIDQAILGPRLTPLDYRLRTTPWSDHRLQIVDLAWPPG